MSPKSKIILLVILLTLILLGSGWFIFGRHKPIAQKTPPVPVTQELLPVSDQTEISTAVQAKESTIPAGTQYSVDLQTIAGDHVDGTFHYENGIRGSFSAQKNQGKWTI